MNLLLKLLPLSFRLGYVYSQAKKISKLKNLKQSEKLSKIYQIEKKAGGRDSFVFDIVNINTISLALAIGNKDMGAIFVTLKSPNDALAYLESAVRNLEKADIKGKESIIFENYVISLIYLIDAFSQQGDIKKCYELGNDVNAKLNNEIQRQPSNKRLNSLYEYANQKIYSAFTLIYKNRDNLSPQEKVMGHNLFKIMLSRDEGNNDIIYYLERL